MSVRFFGHTFIQAKGSLILDFVIFGFDPCHHSDPGNIPEGKILIADQGSLADFRNETLLSLMCDIRKGNLKNAVGAVRHIAIGKIAGNHGRIAALCPQ